MPEVKVSILVAARNEEASILRCLRALDALRFPQHQLEILIGNDQSTDQTGPIVTAFIRDKPHFQLVGIHERIGNQAGKANVLAQLARQATGNFLFFTDADIAVHADWITNMLREFSNPNVGIVTGCTQIVGQGIWENCQAIEWLYAQRLLKTFNDMGLPLTAMGNNMAVRREAYEAVGGYENLPFSVVEDFLLFNEIRHKGYGSAHRFEPDVLAASLPTSDWSAWLRQRKRWMVGAMQTPWYFPALFVGQALFYPLLLLLAFWQPLMALTIWLGKWLLQSLHIAFVLKKFNRTDLFPYLFIFDAWAHVTALTALIYYLLPTKIVWKDRTYNVMNNE